MRVSVPPVRRTIILKHLISSATTTLRALLISLALFHLYVQVRWKKLISILEKIWRGIVFRPFCDILKPTPERSALLRWFLRHDTTRFDKIYKPKLAFLFHFFLSTSTVNPANDYKNDKQSSHNHQKRSLPRPMIIRTRISSLAISLIAAFCYTQRIFIALSLKNQPIFR